MRRSDWRLNSSALLDSIGDPVLTAQAGFGAMGIKAQAGEMGEVLRWAEATIAWADGDPTKGGNPLWGRRSRWHWHCAGWPDRGLAVPAGARTTTMPLRSPNKAPTR